MKHVKEGDDILISWMPYGADSKTEYLKWSNIIWKNKNIKSLIFTWAEHTVMHSQFVSKMDKNHLEDSKRYDCHFDFHYQYLKC